MISKNIILYSLPLLLLISCNSGGKEGPVEVVVKFYSHISSGQTNEAFDLIDQKGRVDITLLRDRIVSGDWEGLSPGELLIAKKSQTQSDDLNELSPAEYFFMALEYRGGTGVAAEDLMAETDASDSSIAYVSRKSHPPLKTALIYEHGEWKIHYAYLIEGLDGMIEFMADRKGMPVSEYIDFWLE